MAAGEEREQVEPEPEEEVDLLVDDVEREHAQAVELLLARRRAHAVERATGREVGVRGDDVSGPIRTQPLVPRRVY